MINKVGVVGAGQMGNGIAHVFALTNHRVVLYDISENQLNKALKTIEENLKRQFKKGVISEDQIKNTITNITTTANLNDLSDIDFAWKHPLKTNSLNLSFLENLMKSPEMILF